MSEKDPKEERLRRRNEALKKVDEESEYRWLIEEDWRHEEDADLNAHQYAYHVLAEEYSGEIKGLLRAGKLG